MITIHQRDPAARFIRQCLADAGHDCVVLEGAHAVTTAIHIALCTGGPISTTGALELSAPDQHTLPSWIGEKSLAHALYGQVPGRMFGSDYQAAARLLVPQLLALAGIGCSNEVAA